MWHLGQDKNIAARFAGLWKNAQARFFETEDGARESPQMFNPLLFATKLRPFPTINGISASNMSVYFQNQWRPSHRISQ